MTKYKNQRSHQTLPTPSNRSKGKYKNKFNNKPQLDILTIVNHNVLKNPDYKQTIVDFEIKLYAAKSLDDVMAWAETKAIQAIPTYGNMILMDVLSRNMESLKANALNKEDVI